jgi:hypothetical protein
MVFNLMFRDRRDLAGLPLSAWRIHLEDVVAGADLVLPVRRLASNGLDAWAQVAGSGYERYVAKDEAGVRGRADEAVAEGRAEGVDRRGGWLAPAALRGGQTMMQLARRTSLAVVLLLASVGTASAECA